MSLTSFTQRSTLFGSQATVTSDLSGTVYYYWFADGDYLDRTTNGTHWFSVEYGTQLRVYVLDSNDPGLNPEDIAPESYPRHLAVWWVRGDDTDPVKYRVEYKKDGGSWTAIKAIDVRPDEWQWEVRTAPLADGSTYIISVVPIDLAGNDGTRKEVASEIIGCRPTAPDWDYEYDSGTTKCTFSV